MDLFFLPGGHCHHSYDSKINDERQAFFTAWQRPLAREL